MDPYWNPRRWSPTPVDDATYLYEVAHARTGDKSDTLNVVVVPFEEAAYDPLVELVTVDRVEAHFGDLVEGAISRHCVDGIYAMNFVLERALDGGWSRSLRLDPAGKSLSRYMLQLRLHEEPVRRPRG